MNRTKRGYMLINEKKRFIYEGLNTIGRNREATIVLPHASVSHYHSIIVVINDEHYLSDANSSNGTFLGEMKLLPLQLYKINIGDSVRFGLVTATYYKLAGDVNIEADDDFTINVGEDVFQTNTQVVHFSQINETKQFNCTSNVSRIIKTKKRDVVTLRDDVMATINEVETQTLGDEHEVSAIVSINDLPTQLMTHSKEVAEERRQSCCSSYCSINDMPTQIISDLKDDEQMSVTTFDRTSDDIIDETVVVKDQTVSTVSLPSPPPVDSDNELSNDSTDLMTMQPVATTLESQQIDWSSLDNVRQLRRRIRNVIWSDDEEEEEEEKKATEGSSGGGGGGGETGGCSGGAGETGLGRGAATAAACSSYSSSSDEDSDDALIGNNKMKKKKQKKKKRKKSPSVDGRRSSRRRCGQKKASDSDATDVESGPVTSVGVNRSLEEVDRVDDDDDDTDAEKELLQPSMPTGPDPLNDSDVIPATQEPKSSVSTTKQQQQTLDTNSEATLTDSFQLVLTNSPSVMMSEDTQTQDTMGEKVTILDRRHPPTSTTTSTSVKPITVAEVDSCESGDRRKCITFQETVVGTATKDSSSEPFSQLEVTFEEENVNVGEEERASVGVGEGAGADRPTNPLINVFANEGASCSPAAYDTVENKLSKMFEAVPPPPPPPEFGRRGGRDDDDDDNLFLQPTQMIIRDEHVFLKPGPRTDSRISNEVATKSENSAAENDDGDDIFLQPTQVLYAESKLGKNGGDGDDDAFFMQPTQILDFHDRRDVNKNKKQIDKDKVLNDDNPLLFVQHTRILHVECRNKKEKTEIEIVVESAKINSQQSSGEIIPGDDDDDDDALYLQPTQIIQAKPENTTGRLLMTCSVSNDVNGSAAETDEDATHPPPCGGNVAATVVDERKGPKDGGGGGDDDDDDLFSRSTQILRTTGEKIPLKENTAELCPVAKQNRDVKEVSPESVSEEDESNRKGRTPITDGDLGRGTRTQISPNQDGEEEEKKKRDVTEDKRTEITSNEASSPPPPTLAPPPPIMSKQSQMVAQSETVKKQQMGERPSDVQIRSDGGVSVGTTSRGRHKRTRSTEEKSAMTIDEEEVDVDGEGPDTRHKTRKTVSWSIRPPTYTKRDNSEDEFEDKRRSPPKKPKREESSSSLAGKRNTGGVRQSARSRTNTVSKEKSAATAAIATRQHNKENTKKKITSAKEQRPTATPPPPAPSVSSPPQRSASSAARKRNVTNNRNNVRSPSPSSTTRSEDVGERRGARIIRKKKLTRLAAGAAAAATKGQNELTSIDGEGPSGTRKRTTRARQIREEDVQGPSSMTTMTIPQQQHTTPERNKRKLKPKVVFTMLESPELETIIRSLGGQVVDSVESSTVVVTGSVKRSQKLLSAVGLAKPICSPEWLRACKKANAFVDPWDHILTDREAETKWNFSLRESLRRSGAAKLLKNYTFQIMVSAAQDVLKGAIESCGGKCVSRAPAKASRANFVIVSSPENKGKYAKFMKEDAATVIITSEAIFDGVLRQECHFQDHLLS